MSRIPSLKIGSDLLRNISELSVPTTPKRLLNLCKSNADFQNQKCHLWQCGAPIPTAIGPLICTRVLRNEPISNMASDRIRKPKYLLELELDPSMDAQIAQQIRHNFDAGDSYNFLFENPADEVELLSKKLGLYDRLDTMHQIIRDENAPTNYQAHLPEHCTPRQLLSQFVDIRRAPARSLIRALADHAGKPEERRRLLELASTQGAQEFTRFVRQPNISLAEFLCAFPSVQPPLALLIELLPRLLPRHYTLACFICDEEEKKIVFRFTYSLLAQPANGFTEENGCENGDQMQNGFCHEKRFGVCTQWLLTRKKGDQIWLIQKEPSKFRLPPLSSLAQFQSEPARLLQIPLIMVGPGTGVAPFMAILQKIRHLRKKYNLEENDSTKRVLIYASSCLEDEFLFRSELEKMQNEGFFELVLCESRPFEDMDRPKRIYDALHERAEDVAKVLLENEGNTKGLFYACGDMKNMSRELWACLSEILQKQKGFTPQQAIEVLKRLREQEQLIEDVWS